MKKFITSLSVIFICLLSGQGTKAQLTPIAFGENIQASISGLGEVDIYSFTAASNDIISVLVGGIVVYNGFVTRVEIHNPNGSLLKRVDGNSCRIDTTLTMGGIYTIWIMDDDNSQAGNYGLSLNRIKPFMGTLLKYDTTVENSISGIAVINSYTFSADSDEIITILLGAIPIYNGFQASVEIYNPDGSLLKKVNGNSLRIDTTLPQNGVYTIFVMDDDGIQSSNYGLSLQRIKPPMGTHFNYNSTVQSSISDRAVIDAYIFDAASNAMITVILGGTAIYGGFVCRLEIYKPDGSLLKRLDGNSLNFDTTLPVDGTYTIWIMDDDGIQAGNYGLTLIGNPLPVTWLYFKGQLNKNDIQLTWATVSEYNSKEFIVERSLNGTQFSPMASVPARGNSNLTSLYEFKDIDVTSLKASALYYRLKQIDKDGKFDYSKIVSVTIINKQAIVVKPNPAHDKIFIQLNGTVNNNGSMSIMDMTGRKLISKTISLQSGNLIPVSIKSLSKGMYLLVVESSPGSKWVTKFVKE